MLLSISSTEPLCIAHVVFEHASRQCFPLRLCFLVRVVPAFAEVKEAICTVIILRQRLCFTWRAMCDIAELIDIDLVRCLIDIDGFQRSEDYSYL